MTSTELIAKLAKKNLELEQELQECKQGIEEVKSLLYNIGGPLNDNYKCYTRDQLKDFFYIERKLDV